MLLIVPCFAYVMVASACIFYIEHSIRIRGIRSTFPIFDSNRKVGGIRFLKLGRLNISISVSKNREA